MPVQIGDVVDNECDGRALEGTVTALPSSASRYFKVTVTPREQWYFPRLGQ